MTTLKTQAALAATLAGAIAIGAATPSFADNEAWIAAGAGLAAGTLIGAAAANANAGVYYGPGYAYDPYGYAYAPGYVYAPAPAYTYVAPAPAYVYVEPAPAYAYAPRYHYTYPYRNRSPSVRATDEE